MNIDSLNSGRSIQDTKQANIQQKVSQAYKENEETKTPKSKDKLELSVEAIKLQPIRQKIAEGFYNNPDVLNEVANRLYSEIFGEDEVKK